MGYPITDIQGIGPDTAAILKNLDLVVTSDTALAHLAGALGVNVWVPLPHVPDWRWLPSKTDSPWYPTMKVFRQTQPGNWNDVFEEIARQLAAWITTHDPLRRAP